MRKRKRNRTLKAIENITLAVMVLIASDVFLVSVGKIHLHSGTDLSVYADNANTVTETIKALRGNIYDSTGTIIAEDSRTYNIVCILSKDRPSEDGEVAYVQDKESTAEILANILGEDYDTILGYLSQDTYQTELGTAGRNLTKETKELIESYDLPGIEFTDSIERVYPLGSFASSLIGYAQADESGTTVGKMGLELYLDSYLKGTDGSTTYQVDKNGYILPGMKQETESETNGYDVYLTLNQAVQSTLETSMKTTVDEFSATQVWAAVMEINTGRIIAWGQYPSFDPNEREIEEYTNYGSQLVYEPGSTLKSFTWAAAMNEGVYDGNTTTAGDQYCYGSTTDNIPYRTSEANSFGCIYNAHDNNFGAVTYDKGLVYSANTVAAAIETEAITPDIYLSYLKKFGFWQEVDTDGIPEAIGTLNWQWPGDKLRLSFGQSSSVTMLQMLQAYSAIFGDGNMVKPYVVDSIRDSYDSSKVVYQAETEITGTPITEETAKQMQSLLYRVVNDDDGTARYYRIPECDIIAKTGTAEVTDENGNISTSETINSIMAALPADNPQYMVYYCWRAPESTNTHYLTDSMTSLFRKVAVTYNLAAGSSNADSTDNVVSEAKTYDMPTLKNHSLEYAENKLADLGVDVIVLGEGSSVIDQYPSDTSDVSTGQRVFLLTDTNSFTMPDLTGWTRSDVAALWSVTGFAFQLDGDGLVTSQSIPAGTVVTKGTEIQVVFSN